MFWVSFLVLCFMALTMSHVTSESNDKHALHSMIANYVSDNFEATMIPPSEKPALLDTYSATGFIYMASSYNSDCSDVFGTYGIPVNECFVDVSYAFKIQLVEDSCTGGIVQYFTDVDCTNLVGTSDLAPFSGTCGLTDATVFTPLNKGETPVYTTLMCSTATSPPVQKTSAITKFYVDSDDCSVGTYGFISYTNGTCVNTDGSYFYMVCNEDANNGYPMQYKQYNGASVNCSSSTFFVYNKYDTCQSQSYGRFYYAMDDEYEPPFLDPSPSVSSTPFPTSANAESAASRTYDCSYVYNPTAMPTPMPSAVPTGEPTAQPSAKPTPTPSAVPTVNPTATPSAKPTLTPSAVPSVKPSAIPTASPTTAYPTGAVAAVVTFSAQQNINGISLSTYNADVTLYSMTIAKAVAASMQGVVYTDVTNMAATTAATSSVAVAAGQVMNRLRSFASSNAISVSYTVSTSTTLSASSLEDQLTESADNGVFDAELQYYATTNGATGLDGATTGPITIDNDDSSSNGLSAGAIAGIVIGSVAGLVLIAAAIYYCMGMQKPSLASQPANIEL